MYSKKWKQCLYKYYCSTCIYYLEQYTQFKSHFWEDYDYAKPLLFLAFSLTEWSVEHGASKGDLTDVQRNQLLETLGVAPYIGDNNCYLSEPPFSPSQNGWNNGIMFDIALWYLINGIFVCYQGYQVVSLAAIYSYYNLLCLI